MEGVDSLQKKILKGIILFITIFILSTEAAEIVNFVYLVPFSLPFFLMLNSTETELHSENFNFIMPFVFGVISDIVTLKGIFVLSIGFVVFSYIVFYLVKIMAINKERVFAFFCLVYAIFVFLAFNTPLWVSLFVFALGFLQWRLTSFIISLIVTDKHSGEA